VLVPILAFALLAVVAGCGSGGKAGGSVTTGAPTTSSSAGSSTTTSSTTSSIPVTGPSLATIAGSSTLTIGGKKIAVPTDSGRPISPNIDDGQQIIITVGGFLPQRLYATPSALVVWTNLTNEPQQVVFDHFAVHSPVIPPGGKYSWTSQASESISYHSVSGMHAVLVLNPPGV
jgi:uncharacterized Zn-binding protein involved in type VI secretion